MKKLFLITLCLLVFAASSARAAIICVGGGVGCTSTTKLVFQGTGTGAPCTGTTSLSYTPAAAGDTIFLLGATFSTGTNPSTTFSDSKGDTCTVLNAFVGTIVGSAPIGMCVNVAGGATTFNMIAAGGTGTCTVAAALVEFSGLGTAPTLDVTSTTGTGHVIGTGQSSTTAIISGTTANTTTAGEVALASVLERDGTVLSGPTNSFSDVNTNGISGATGHNLAAYRIVSSTGNYNTAWTLGSNSNADGGVLTVQPGGVLSTGGWFF